MSRYSRILTPPHWPPYHLQMVNCYYMIVAGLVLIIIPSLPEGGGGGYTVLPLSVCPSKIFFVAFFSVTVDGRNLIFGHKRHIGIPYCG
jgi:hypothetical protein